MKICNVSRKSLFVYVAVFFCMLFFEEARLTPLLEREGANFPFLQTINQYLHTVGEKTKIYAFNSLVQNKIASIAQDDFFSSDQKLLPKIEAWRENLWQERNEKDNPLKNFAATQAVTGEPVA